MSDITAEQRCPRCGNSNRADSFTCSFCGKRLRVERIENIPFFKRYESEEWIKPYPFYTKIFLLFVNPSKAFWDINHKRSKSPGFLIILFNALLYGCMGLAISSHFKIVSIQGSPVVDPMSVFLINVQLFIAFFVFGFCFYAVFFLILVWFFIKGANYAVGFSKRLETRFGKEEKKKEQKRKEELSPFSIYKGGTLLQKQASHKYKMLLCSFAPFLIINAIKILIILVAFPTVPIDASIMYFDVSIYDAMFNSPVWAVLDIIDALTIAIWVPILMTIAIRELANSSTFRVLISSIIIGVIVSIFFYFSRPTLFG